jgi:hypothetical protein
MDTSDPRPTAIWARFAARERLAINFTLTCNISCAHCIVESSPHRKERLSLEEVDAALRFGQRHDKRHVTFSGGEVFLFPEQVCRAVARARELGYAVDVESNGFWARSEAIARAKLQPFVDAGIGGLSVSSDAYHVAFFPVDRTILAVRAARSFGLVTEIAFCPSNQPEVDAGIRAALDGAGEPYIVNELLDRGRGKDLYQLTMNRRIADLQDCDSLTTTVHATGDLYACCELDTSTDAMKKTPVFLGSLRDEQDSPARQAEYSARETLVSEFYNPRSAAYFRRLVDEHPLFRELASQRFHNICDFCTRALGDPQRVAALRELVQLGGTGPAVPLRAPSGDEPEAASSATPDAGSGYSSSS